MPGTPSWKNPTSSPQSEPENGHRSRFKAVGIIYSSGKGLRDVGDEIVRMFYPDRHANQGRSNSDFTTSFLGEPRMHGRRRMANQGFCATQTNRKLEYLKSIEKRKCLHLLSFDLKRERRPSRTRLPFHQDASGMIGGQQRWV